jgi:peptidoglycan/LPS O-acetylase OafA/YrhL
MATLIETADFGADAPVAHGWRREVDGLRAVAVLPVILFHAGFTAFAGGWLGVDVFFVISGYLITGILLRDLAAGSFSIARFYERRARRILPALIAVLLACIPFALAWLSPLELRDFARGFIATVLSVSNVLYWQELDYFGPAAEHLPLLHTWSLGIEEQFYLLFPPALAALWRWRRLLVPILAAGAASLALAAWAAAAHPQAGFFLLPFRAWELLLGAALAMAPAPTTRAAPALALAGLVAVLTAIAAAPQLPNVLPVVLACAGAGLVIRYAGAGDPTGRLLATPPLVGIGLVSYSAYLWHQPILAFARLRFGDTLPPATLLSLGALAVLLAWPTWAFVERPFRRPGTSSPRRPLTIAAAALAAMLAVGAAGLATNGLMGLKSPAVQAILATVTDTNPYRDACKTDLAEGNPAHPVPACLVPGSRPGVAFYGDSHADALQGGLWPLAEAAGFRWYSVTRSACPPIPGLDRTGEAASPACDDFVRGVEAYVADAGFEVVVLAARWTAGVAATGFDNGEGGADGPPGDFLVPIGADPATADARAAAVVATYVAGIERLLAAGHRVVLVYPIPEAGWNVPEELARRREGSRTPVQLSTAYEVYLARNAAVLAAFDAIDSPNLFRVRPAEFLCQGSVPGRCINNIGDRPLNFDSNHLNTFGAGLVSRGIVDAIEAARAASDARADALPHPASRAGAKGGAARSPSTPPGPAPHPG